MKKTIYVFIALLLVVAACKKDKIQPVNITTISTGTSSNLYDIIFTGNRIIIPGGERYNTSEIVLSEDGGNTWVMKSYPESGKGMYAVCKSPNGTIYTTGIDSKLLKSKDNGSNWQYIQINLWQTCQGIAFPEDNKGFVITDGAQRAGTIAKIDSNGNILSTKDYNFGFSDIYINGQIGYVSAFGTILKTTNGGDTWDYTDVKNDFFTALSAISDNELWACGSGGSIVHTTDGGKNWERLRNGNNILKADYFFKDILFVSKTEGWAVGDKGLMVYTTDGGKHWKEYKSFTDKMLRSIALAPDGKLYVCGDGGTLFSMNRN